MLILVNHRKNWGKNKNKNLLSLKDESELNLQQQTLNKFLNNGKLRVED